MKVTTKLRVFKEDNMKKEIKIDNDPKDDAPMKDGRKLQKKGKKKKRLEQEIDDGNNNLEDESVRKIKKIKKRSRSEDVIKAARKNDEASLRENNVQAARTSDTQSTTISATSTNERTKGQGSSSTPRPIVESSALPPHMLENKSAEAILQIEQEQYPISLLLFYQYVFPLWNESTYKLAQEEIYTIGTSLSIHGRVRVAKEGLNCTLSGTKQNIIQFCTQLRKWKPSNFHTTEFKITHHLEQKYHFPALKIIPVLELVHYGLDGGKSISTVPSPEVLEQYSGTHLEPSEYHQKLAEPNTIVIDVRNHYEAAIGHFHIPSSTATTTDRSDDTTVASSKFLDPKMRKSTEFPIWLDDPKTKEQLKGKQVLMYCTGGIRCERASALLQYKIQNDPTVQELNIKGVYQLQGGIDKYFKEFPDGGYWVGKNYTFDKRCAHKPVESNEKNQDTEEVATKVVVPLGKCASCNKPWDNYGGKPCRCPTCGVPNLICKDCYTTNKNKKIKNIRCDLCVEQNVLSKKELRDKEMKELVEFEQRNQSLVAQKQPSSDITSDSTSIFTTKEKPNVSSNTSSSSSPVRTKNIDGTTRLFLRNMCRNTITEEILLEALPKITHIVWKVDGKSGKFFGQGWVEMESPEAAEYAVSQSGKIVVCGRSLYIEYQRPDSKDIWPPPRSAINRK